MPCMFFVGSCQTAGEVRATSFILVDGCNNERGSWKPSETGAKFEMVDSTGTHKGRWSVAYDRSSLSVSSFSDRGEHDAIFTAISATRSGTGIKGQAEDRATPHRFRLRCGGEYVSPGLALYGVDSATVEAGKTSNNRFGLIVNAPSGDELINASRPIETE